MPCTSPRLGFRHRHVNPLTGLRSITYSRSQALHPVEEQILPCGQCTYCRLKKSQDWGIRVALESSLYSQNSFITLTYNQNSLPKHSFLDYNAPVLFMKRLRERYGSGIRSFGCAEYGEKFSRPHYHICLLNHDFSDKKSHGKSTANFGKNKRENDLFISQELQDLWPCGHSLIGSLTLESASYVARYCTKKITGTASEKHYETACERTGEILARPPERSIAVSRSRGLGHPWYMAFGKFVRDHDCIYLQGKRYSVPKYFDSLTEKIDPDRFEEIKKQRRLAGTRSSDALERTQQPGTLDRLLVIDKCQNLSFKLLKRGIENG